VKSGPLALDVSGDCGTEEEGFEPPVPFGTAVFKTEQDCAQSIASKGVTCDSEGGLHASLQRGSEGEILPVKLPAELAEVVRKWDALPAHIRQAVMTLVSSVTVTARDGGEGV